MAETNKNYEARFEQMNESMSEIKEMLIEVRADVKHLVSAKETHEESLQVLHRWRNGSLDTPGVSTRLDRVERFMTSVLWIAGVAMTAAGGAITLQVMEMLSGR